MMAGPYVLSNRLQNFQDRLGSFGDTVLGMRQQKKSDERQATLDAQNFSLHNQRMESGALELSGRQREEAKAKQLEGWQGELSQLDATPNVEEAHKDRIRAKIESTLTGKPVTSEEMRARRADEQMRRDAAQFELTAGKAKEGRAGEAHKSQLATDEAQRGEIRKRTELLGIPKPSDNKDAFQTEDSMRKEFTALNSGYKEVASALGRVQASAENPSAAGDMSLIFAYMKMLDPGSTVREGEQAQAEQARGVPASIVAQYNKALDGTKLGTTQRKDFTDRAQKLFEREQLLYDNRKQQFTEIAKTRGLRPESIVLDYTSGSAGMRDSGNDSKALDAVFGPPPSGGFDFSRFKGSRN